MEGTRVGQPKKYSQPWKSLVRRIYLEEDMFTMLRQLKVENSFSSDDATTLFLQGLCLVPHRHVEVQATLAALIYRGNVAIGTCSCIGKNYWCPLRYPDKKSQLN